MFVLIGYRGESPGYNQVSISPNEAIPTYSISSVMSRKSLLCFGFPLLGYWLVHLELAQASD